MPKPEAANFIKSGDYLLGTGYYGAARKAYLKAQEEDPVYQPFIEKRLELTKDAEAGYIDPKQELENSGVDMIDFNVYGD